MRGGILKERIMITGRTFALTLTGLPLLAGSGFAQSQYPTRPIRVVVPFPAGGSTDVAARLIAEQLSPVFHQQIYVENKSGANGTVGIEDAAKGKPDGYTILVSTDSVASNPHLYHSNIDPSKDLLPIIQVSRQPIVLAVHPSLGVASLAELIALAKKQPGLPYATGSGAGSGQHIAVQWFSEIAGIKLEHVPYRGGGQAINDLIGGHVKIGSLGSTPLMPHYKAGTLRLLAQTTKERAPSLPEVPTYEEAGIKGLVLDQWLGVFTPAGTPAPIVERLNGEIGKALADAGVRKNLQDSAQEPIGGTAEQFAGLVREDYAKLGRLVKDLNIKAE
jgi:tripartite-type tricarboxylate transporter receptor subunit TctC